MPKTSKSAWGWASLLIGGPLLITSFQNCAQMFETPVLDMGGDFASIGGATSFSGGCEAELMNLYSQTYFQFLNQACGSCHTNGPGIGQFGHPDFTTSYGAFKNITRAAVERNIINPAHQPPFTGAHHQPALNAFAPRWAAAETSYGVCTGNTVAGSGIATLNKTYPAIIAAAGNPNTWTRLTWNLSTELKDTASLGRIPLTVGIEARVATINGVRQGYEFRNPTVRINTGFTGPFRVTALRLFINNVHLDLVTTYSAVDFSVTTNTDVNISPGTAYALAAMSPVVNTDTFGIEFGDIKNATGGSIGNPVVVPPTVTLPATVTLAQLLSSDPVLGVFRQSCVGCHSATNSAGGLDLTDAADTKLKANEIYRRMNTPDNPMPTNGLLINEKRELVRIWRDTGAN